MFKAIALISAATLLSGAANAATTGFTLTIGGSTNIPTVTLTNAGDLGEITAFSITMGDADNFNFDGVASRVASAGVGAGLTMGDTNINGGDTPVGRYSTIAFTAINFMPGGVFTFSVDVDSNYGNTTENYITTLLPGGSFDVTFAGGLQETFSIDLTATPENNSAPYSYAASVTSAVPLPAALPLLLTALGGAALVSTRRKRRAA